MAILVAEHRESSLQHPARQLILLDPATMATSALPIPSGWGETKLLGYAQPDHALVLVHGRDEEAQVVSFSLDTGSFEDRASIGRALDMKLLGEGRRVALYRRVLRQGDELGHQPPHIDVIDLKTGETLIDFELSEVTHGYVPIPEERASDPSFPFALVQPGIAWDLDRGLIFAVHADGGGVTVGDLNEGDVETTRYESGTSLWSSAFSQLIPPAEARGAGNQASRHASLSGDGTRLISTGLREDYLRDPATGALTIISRPLETLIIDTTTMEAVTRLDLMATTSAVSPDGSRWILTGSDSRQVVCDELCHGQEGRPPEFVTDDTIFAGLYLIDTETLEVVAHTGAGTNYYARTFHRNHMLTERFSSDGDFWESIDVRTGEVTGRVPLGLPWFIANEAGVFRLELQMRTDG
jgi:hypothetical protein